MHGRRHSALSIFVASLAAAAAQSFAQEVSPRVAIETAPNGFRIIPDGVGSYFLIRRALSIESPFGNVAMTLSDEELIYTPPLGEPMAFFDAEAISVFSPRDSDRDGMDDIYELGKNLDPLNDADALLPSSIAGLTNLAEYRLRFALSAEKPQYYSREVSTFNFGAPRGSFEAISREQSIFNFGSSNSVEAHAREVSVFNGEHHPIAGFPQVYSREQSIFNFGSSNSVEALAREVSVFNGDRPPIAGYAQIYSRETSVFNLGAPRASVEAVSREVSIFNNLP